MFNIVRLFGEGAVSKEKTQKKWCKPRHKFVRWIVALVLVPYIKIRYRLKVNNSCLLGKKQYLVLFNHQTAFDQFFVGMTVPGVIYYIDRKSVV